MAVRGADLGELVKDLRRQVTALEDDLRARALEVPEFHTPLRAEYDDARKRERTAAMWETWLDQRVTQVAAAWVLGTVFVRFCEDNGLIQWPFIAGPGERLADAEERHEAYFRERPQDNDRDWIVAAFTHLAQAHPTAEGLFEPKYNPLWEITPSFEAATALLQFWRRRGDDGEIRYDFTDPDWDTRFLGDLYQDLSEHARKTYALLQTPEFVEEFILDLTLEPAVKDFGLKDLRSIDPACGSGHFLLGMFRRVLDKWRAAEPGTDRWELIQRTLSSVHGCDKNPFAVSIARFRLLVAVLREANAIRLDQAPQFPINIAVGDSLMHGRGAPGIQGELFALDEPHTYATEDINEYVRSCDLLGKGSYHVVVGNPPYITVKDKQENKNYRDRYDACSGKYALSVPFAQRLFQLAIRRSGSERDAGFVGQITANSFMKREFGKKLIEDFFRTVQLTHVIDTSGAYIPGHGTPTVILVGRNHSYRKDDPVRAVLGIRGEPSQPEDPAKGLVWSAIVKQLHQPGSESEWVSVEDFDRQGFSQHPWSLSGGGAADLLAAIESTASTKLGDLSESLGITSFTLEDDLYLLPSRAAVRRSIGEWVRPMVTGDALREWWHSNYGVAIFPYSSEFYPVDVEGEAALLAFMWPGRTMLSNNVMFGRQTKLDAGLAWYEYGRLTASKLRTPLSIAFAFVATHNHFVLDRGGKVFKQSAPVIKLPEGAGEDEHLELLGVLNSSTACFWLKQVSHNKGNGADSKGARTTAVPWEDFYEFTGTKLQEFPLPAVLPLELGRALDSLAQDLAAREPSAVADRVTPTRERLDAARAAHARIRARMIALQEELDWTVYHSYGLLDDAERARLVAPDLDSVPEIQLGERAFEIVLARRVAAGEAETAWFERHGSTPITEIPAHWPDWYRQIVQARIDVISQRRDIALIERPECKRRWASETWERKEADALRTWLLDRCERRELWFELRDGLRHPRTMTVYQLADQFRGDTDMHAVAALYAADHLRKPDLPLAQVLDKILADQHVPYLAALRYKDSGLRKRAQWEQVWEKQREEDRTGERLDIAVPPKYSSADFRKTSYWTHRGKLDVPKERFISYPGASPDADPSLLLGWAGWDHKDQAQALVNLVNDRTTDAGWDTDRLTPLIAGLAELMPWVRQWHGEYDEEWDGAPADEFSAYLLEQRTKHQLTDDDLTNWRPTPARRGRRGTAKETQQ
ncbi:BREX-2 system adenine-specific DNA-methyltransferase PglX [Saccharomonospora xinjiangensis]|uniref:site-specific DNA-methyltransferase (adenine-specific) n=1 Tax=Saccharomonospora xinjiangensis XJ-54 TaxID=882086 RepID=I0V0S7_9PSEU|nr:BREX-2 system adenine-specific DNA-methyltransferase PglX [Saccharomonospora xinjiangensis]EID53730.1 type I restriction-modification system methyltransferase subunit [Saccharomonospora xinjiangensis XJ-54]